MSTSRPQLSVALPAYNEVATLADVIRGARTACERLGLSHEVLVIDDGSTDGTAELADALAREHANVRVVHHRANEGFSGAIRSALTNAHGERIFLAPADGQFSFADLPHVWQLSAQADVVIVARERRIEGVGRVVLSRGFHAVVRALLGLPWRDLSFCLLLSASALPVALSHARSRGAAYLPELLARLRAAEASFTEIVVPQRPRLGGRAKGAQVRVMLLTFLDLVAIAARLRLMPRLRRALRALSVRHPS